MSKRFFSGRPVMAGIAAFTVTIVAVTLAIPAGAAARRLASRLAVAARLDARRPHHVPRGPAPTRSALASRGTPAVGALFTITSSGALAAHFCSASVIDSPSGNLVITAAHCLAGRMPGQVAVVPGYRNGQAPYGSWTVTRVFTTQLWAQTANPDDDVAFLQVSQPRTGIPVQSVTGAERLGTSQQARQPVSVTGYPDTSDMPVTCQNMTRPVSSTQLEFDCDGYSDGTSGSPLIVGADPATGLGTVIGVIGGLQQGGNTDAISYAARIGPDVATLYETAITAIRQAQ